MIIRLSWSQLRTFEECHQKLKLHRQGNRAPLADQRVFFAGTTTDRVVRDWLLNDPENNPGVMPLMVESIMQRELENIANEGGRVKWKSKTDREEVLRDCIEAVTKIEPALNRLVLPFEYQPDFRFTATLQLPNPVGVPTPIQLIGALDILVKRGNKWDIWDVKHTKDNDYWRKTAGQLTFYDIAIDLLFDGEPGYSGLLQPLCKERVKPYPVTDELRSQMYQRIANMANSIMLDDFPAEPKGGFSVCNYCDVRHACTRFKPVIVNGKRKIPLENL